MTGPILDVTFVRRRTCILQPLGLGFGHDPISGKPQDRRPAQRLFNNHAKSRGCNIERVWERDDLRLTHPSFVDEQAGSPLVARL